MPTNTIKALKKNCNILKLIKNYNIFGSFAKIPFSLRHNNLNILKNLTENIFICIISCPLVELKGGELPRPVGGRRAEHVDKPLSAGVLQHGDALRRMQVLLRELFEQAGGRKAVRRIFVI